MDIENKRKKLIEEISRIESHIAYLNERKSNLLSELDKLPYNSNPFREEESEQESFYLSVNEKLGLFSGLFKGREDVYARLWTSKKTGKSGYSPVCKNEWIPKVCQRRIMKCSDCPNREFVLFNEDVIRKHLEGKEIIGIYPLLQNENCNFLAVDFDKEGWMDNVGAFKETCLNEGVPVAIERSKSGNGAHAWIFFDSEISAITARKLGSSLITRTMSSRYQMDMKSYDRLFPNQDTMPKGGLGNLIAMPFQKESVKAGNTVFIDEKGIPYTNQWKVLYELKKMSAIDVERIAQEASKTGQIIGVSISPCDENDSPWQRLPSGKRKYKTIIKNLPKIIELIIADRLYITTKDIPSVLLNQIKQLSAFQNPEFYKKQSMRLSTFSTPRVICCAEILDDYLSLPRGCLDDICFMLNEYGIEVSLRDERVEGQKSRFKFYGTLTKEQNKVSKKILEKEIGVLVAPPGTGKTVLAIHAIAKRKKNVLVLVHRKPLMEQWRLQLSSFLGIDIKEIGQIGAGKNKPNGMLDVAMFKSMEQKGLVNDKIIDYGFIIVDECHHVSAVSFERVLMRAKAKYILGLTATPYRRDGHQPIIHMQCGSILHQIKRRDLDMEYFVIPRKTDFTSEWSDEKNIYELWPNLINYKERNELIIADIHKIINKNRFPIILTERREHLKILEEMLEDKVEYLAVLHGGINPKKRKEVLDNLRDCDSKTTKAILATGSYIGEGFDEPRLDTLFITMPISFKGRIVQYAGRLHRESEGKENVCIYDYLDHNVPVLLGMYRKRLKTYEKIGYKIL